MWALVVAAVPAELLLDVAVLLFVWAILWVFQKPIVAVLSRIPVVGSQFAAAVGGAMTWLMGQALTWAKNGLAAATEIVGFVWSIIVATIGAIVQAAEDLGGQLAQVAKVAAGEIGQVADRLASLWALVTHLDQLLAATRTALSAVSGTVSGILSTRIPAAIAAAEAYARSIAAQLAAQAVAPVRVLVDALPAQVRAWIAAAVASVQAWAAGEIGKVSRALSAAVTAVRADVGLLGRQVGQLGLDVNGRIDGLLGVLAPILALNLVRVVPRVVEDVETMRRDCVEPTCSALTPNLDVLNALNQGLILAGMLALVGDAIRDPEGAARATGDTVKGLHDLAASVLEPLTGAQL